MKPTEDKYKELHDVIENHEIWIEKSSERGVELRLERNTLGDNITKMESLLDAERFKVSENARVVTALVLERRQREAELIKAKQELDARIHEDKLKALISEQPTFEQALRGQIETFAKNRFSGLSFEEGEDSVTPAYESIIKRFSNTRDFSAPTSAWRGAKISYDNAIKEVCDKKLKGQKITSQDAFKRFEQINACLNAQEVNLFG